MNLATSILILTLTGIPALPALAENPATLIANQIKIGMTKAQVQQVLGKPTRTASNDNIWYYGQRAIEFKNGKVSDFPGAQG